MMMDVLDDLHRSRNLTLIHVTHNLNFARRADRVLALERGRLVPAVSLSESELPPRQDRNYV
jgi:ABC-type methionine transport system ATPase subunit